MATDQEIN